jgi:hypothetical protein
MVALAYTVAFEGVEARLVEVQCAIAPGMPSFAVVGLPDKAVSRRANGCAPPSARWRSRSPPSASR